jgi:prolyl 4-hydroxylase
MLSIEGRCPIDPNAKPAWKPGDLNAMFEKLTSEPYLSKYDVKILSKDPWVITMENVLSEIEANRLIELGTKKGYERSTHVGRKLANGTYDHHVSTRRTSMNAWCQEDCTTDPIALPVLERLSNLTGINDTNAEHLQMLR